MPTAASLICLLPLNIGYLCNLRLRDSVHLVDGSIIKSGLITQETIPLSATMASNYKELLHLDAIASCLFPILDVPWLQALNSCINWATREIQFLSPYCQQHCLHELSRCPPSLLCMDSDSEACISVSVAYLYFLVVFSKGGQRLFLFIGLTTAQLNYSLGPRFHLEEFFP